MTRIKATDQRGLIEPISWAIIAFVAFVIVMAIGIGVDRAIHEQSTQETKGGDPMEPNTPPRGPGNPPPGR